MAGALARAATMPFRLAAKGAKAAVRGAGKAASRAGSSVRRGSARVRRTATSARRNVRRTYRRQVRSRFRGRSGGGRTRSNRSGSRPRNRNQRRSGRNTRDRGSNRDRNRRQSSGREGFDNNGSQQQQQQQQRPQSEYRERYRRGRQGIDYRFAGNGFLPGVATGVILGGTTTTAFYPGSQQTTPYYGGGGGGGYYPANPQQSFYSPQQQGQGQGQGQYYPPSPFSSSSQYPPAPTEDVKNEGEKEEDEDVQEPEDAIEQAPRAPFSPEELKSLALHNAIPHRRIKSLIVIEGPLLLDFIKASNDFLAEPNPRKQVSKGITMVKMAEKMDLRFGTHALGWVKAVRNRPRGWSLLHAFRYADALTEEQIIEISDMDDAKVPDYLTDTTVELDDTYTEPLSIECKIGKRPSGSSSSSSSANFSSSSGAGGAEEDISLTSSVKDRFCIFYRRHRKVLVFHLNGLVEGYSYIDSKTAKGNNVPRMITISEVPFTRMTAAETRCEHLRMFSQARLLATLSNLLSQGSPLLAGGGGGGGVGQESVRDVLKNPKTNVGSIYGFSTGFELTSRVHPLVPLALSEDQMKEYRFGIKEMSTFNNTVKALVEVVNSHQAVVEKLFVGSTRFSSSIGNLK